MPSSTEHHLEHAHHNQHAAADPFDKQVAMTIAIVAAFLAFTTMLSHRGHTETLSLQTQANIVTTESSDQWNFYQAKNIRLHIYQALLETNLQTPPPSADSPLASKPGKGGKAEKFGRDRWLEQFEKNEKDLPQERKKAEDMKAEADKLREESHVVHERVTRYDYGEVGLELAMILCSVAVLTKRRWSWYAGILCGLFGMMVVISGWLGLFMSAGHH
jgi:hypothetical protein